MADAAHRGFEAHTNSSTFSASRLHRAAKRGDHKTVAALLAAGKDPNARDSLGLTPLHWAAGAGQAACVGELVSAPGIKLEARGARGMTALFLAAALGQTAVVRELAAAGADVEAAEDNGMTPLGSAAINGLAAVARELLAAGASAAGRAAATWTPLHCAAYSGNVEIIHILLDAGAEINATVIPDPEAHVQLGSGTALFTAAVAGQLGAVQELVAAGADLEACDCRAGARALLLAARAGHVDVVCALAAHGADINARDEEQGYSCLHHFMAWCCTAVAPGQLRRLLDAGADAALASETWPTPLHLLLMKFAWRQLPRELRGEVYKLHPSPHDAELARLLVAAGCPVDRSLRQAPGWVLRSSVLQFWTRYLRVVDSEQPPQQWPRGLDANLLAMTSALVQGLAGEQPKAWLEFVTFAVHTGCIELVKAVAAAFGGRGLCRWKDNNPQQAPLATAARCLCGALEQLSPPPEGRPWPEAHRSLVLHFCRLAAVLLEAGCPPACIVILGQPVFGCTLRDLPSRLLLKPVPWAREVLSFLPLMAAGVQWSPAAHADFPPAFRAAAKALLLVDNRRQRAELGQASREGGGVADSTPGGEALPPDVLHHILRLAARDLPAWVPELQPPAGPVPPARWSSWHGAATVVGTGVAAALLLTWMAQRR